MRDRETSEEVVITVHTYSNRSLGIFVMFLGLVTTWPLWYMYCMWFASMPQTLTQWLPAVIAAVVLTVAGFLLAFASYKRIVVNPRWIRIVDGPLHQSVTFHWTSDPRVRLQSIVSERNDRPKTTWIVKLLSERFDYTIDERLDRQLESRGIAEAVAKALGCPLLERDEEGEVVIEARDLDMPFRQRVEKNPALLGKPIAQPPNAGVLRTESERALTFSWGIVTGGLILSIVAIGLILFVFSAIPLKLDQPSYFEYARRAGDYHLYLRSAAVILFALVVLAGFRIRVSLTPTEVQLYETLWRFPFVSRSISNCDIEEIHVFHTVSGPTVQVVSDEALLQIRTSDSKVAGWLAHEIRQYLVDKGGPPPGVGSDC